MADQDSRGASQGQGDIGESADRFVDLVLLEQYRSERYNHYFVVALLNSATLGLPDLLRLASASFRASDLLGIVDPQGRFHRVMPRSEGRTNLNETSPNYEGHAVGILFPETDRAGAQVALNRITSVLVNNEISIGCAVYPEDSTSAEELVAIAAAM